MRRSEQIFSTYLDSDDDDQSDVGGFEEDAFKRTIECVCDCFEKACLVNGKFDEHAFLGLSQTLFKQDIFTSSFDRRSFSQFKGKFTSFMMRKVFVMLAMTKKQMDTINNFFKAILSFLSDENDKLDTHSRWVLFMCEGVCQTCWSKRRSPRSAV